MFFVGASVYIISAVFFVLFGTGNIQPWNFDDEKDADKVDKNDRKEMSEMTIKNESYRKDTSLSAIS